MTIHDMMVSRLIVESLAKKGKVTLEEAKFYTDFSRNVLNKIIEETVLELKDVEYRPTQTQSLNESENIIRKLIK